MQVDLPSIVSEDSPSDKQCFDNLMDSVEIAVAEYLKSEKFSKHILTPLVMAIKASAESEIVRSEFYQLAEPVNKQITWIMMGASICFAMIVLLLLLVILLQIKTRRSVK